MEQVLNKQSTAVLVFQESSKQIASMRNMAKNMSKKQAHFLVQRLNERASGIAKKANLPVFTFEAESAQNFGKQIQEAFQNVFDSGYNNVIAIGNDCPTLQANDLIEVSNKLISKDFVLGPAMDGGTYLIALSREVFLQTDLNKITWQSDQVFIEVKKNLNEFEGSVLGVKRDMDTWADFQKAFQLNDSFFSAFKSKVFAFTFLEFKLLDQFRIFISEGYSSLRGPPKLVFI